MAHILAHYFFNFYWNMFEQTLGVSEGQGSLECCSAWGHKESDMNERLSSTSGFAGLY